MAELSAVAALARSELREQVRERLDEIAGPLELVAEQLLGADGRIDFVGLDADGRATLVLVAEPGRELERVADALLERAWVAARLPDWRQLAPQLRLRPEAGARALVVAQQLDERARAVARSAGPDPIGLVRVRPVRNGAGLALLIEGREEPGVEPPALDPALRSRFRTGLPEGAGALFEDERPRRS